MNEVRESLLDELDLVVKPVTRSSDEGGTSSVTITYPDPVTIVTITDTGITISDPSITFPTYPWTITI